MKPVGYLNPAKGNAKLLLEAFAAGCGGSVTTNMQLQDGPAVFYGVEPMTEPVYREVIRLGRPHYYIDNGYFRSKWQGGDFYRITYNQPQHDGRGSSDGKRWESLELPIAPWRERGRSILVALQTDYWYERHGLKSGAAFAERIRELLAERTDRPLVVRAKPIAGQKEPPLSYHLRDAWAVVTHSSNVAIDGLLAGVPAFCVHPCAALTMGCEDLSQIESPVRPDGRESWAQVLADNQWSLSEIRDGTCWSSWQ